MQVAANEAPWVKYVQQGDLNRAYAEYQKTHRTHFVGDSRVMQWVTAKFLGPLVCAFLPWLPVSQNDTDVDLSEEYLLFWKHPNRVGFRLCKKILRFAIRSGKTPLRALAWLAHWMVFQGRSDVAFRIFSHLRPSKVPSRDRMRGELFSLLGNYHFNLGEFGKADRLHHLAQGALKRCGDRFFQMFNLGLWIRISGQRGEIAHLDRILSHFDSLNFTKPDERYGLRLLTYCAYLHSCDGNETLSRQFYRSAAEAYRVSGSELDKTVFKLLEALLLRQSGEIQEGQKAIQDAKAHLDSYGTFVYLSDLIELVASQFKLDRKLRSRMSVKGAPFSLDAVAETEGLAFERDWYRKFFEFSVVLYEALENSSLSTLVDSLAAHLSAVNVRLGEAPGDEYIPLVTEETSGGTDFRFSLWHSGKHNLISFRVPFQKWRNSEMLTAITSLVLSLQTSGARQREQGVRYQLAQMEDQRQLERQIGHDIRSPLTALMMVSNDLEGLAENRRKLLKMSTARIEDIANRLLRRPQNALLTTKAAESLGITHFVERAVIEARSRFSNRSNITLRFKSNEGSQISCVRADRIEFERVISNLINNAVEAIVEGGDVRVEVAKVNDKVSVRVEDDGRGMSAEVLTRVGERGFSYGKENGTGLGLSHAKTCVKQWGGTFVVASEQGVGTTVTVELPASEPPEWIASQLVLSSNHAVVILDDDPSIHEMWRQRLESQVSDGPTLPVFSFVDAESFQEWVGQGRGVPDKFTLLADYELSLGGETGLDLIEKMGLSQNSYLVSSHAWEPEVVERCRSLKLPVIPKELISSVRIVS